MADRLPELVILGAPSRRLLAALREVWLCRSIIVVFAERDIRSSTSRAFPRLRGAVIQPLAFMIVFTLTIGRVADMATGDVPYAAFSLLALVPWTFLRPECRSGRTGS